MDIHTHLEQQQVLIGNQVLQEVSRMAMLKTLSQWDVSRTDTMYASMRNN
jgi:hypothetical protein